MRKRLEALLELCYKGVRNGFVHEGAGCGGAGLAGVEEEVVGGVGEGVGEVGIGEDEGGGFSAEFEVDALEVAGGRSCE